MAYPKKNNYNRNNSNGNSNGGEQRKRSGAKFRAKDKNGNPCTTGWNKSKSAGFVKFLCVFTSKTSTTSSGNGRGWANVMVIVQKPMTPDIRTNGLMDVQTGKVIVRTMGIVLNPQARNGGYCGRYGGK